MATTPLKYLHQYFTTTLNVGGGLDNSQTTGIVIQAVSGLDIAKPGVACLTYADPINTSTAEWITYTSIDGSNELQGVVRGAEGFGAKTHTNGAVVAFPLSESHINNLNAMFDTTGLDLAQIATPADPSSGRNKIYFKSDDKLYKLTSAGVEAEVGAASSGGASYWTDVPGTPTRVSDTQFTITDTSNTNLYDLLFKKGVVLKWLETTTFQTAMVISSSYSANAVTINLVGDSLTAGFTAMKYCIAKAMKETFIVPGTLSAATDTAKTFYPSQDIYPLSCDARVKTAGTTNATEFDVNDDGTSVFGGTAASIASGATSDIDNAAAAPTTAIVAGSAVTLDTNSVSTTAPIEAYVDLFYYPTDWRYR